MKLELVPATHIDIAWRDGACRLAEACEQSGGEITGDQLKMMLSRGERMLVRGVSGGETYLWAALRVDQLPNMRVMHVCEVVGKRPDSFFDELKKYASSIGCSRVRCSAKEAQARLFKRFGFKSVYETLEVIL